MGIIDKHQEWGNEGVEIYNNFLEEKTRNNEEYHYELYSAVDKFSAFDLMQIKRSLEDYSIENVSYIEIKIRNIDINDYDDCLVGADKITRLQKLSLMTDHKCYLVAIYRIDKKIAIWEIQTDCEYQTRETTAVWHTAAPERGKKVKTMSALPLKDAKIYNYH